MSYRQGVLSGVAATLVVGGAAAGGWWLVAGKSADKPAADKPPGPASVAKVAKEDQFNTLTLTPEAEARLGLRVGSVEKMTVSRGRFYGGEVTVPAGHTILVAAPLTGQLRAASGGGVPVPGVTVKKGQPLFLLQPLLTPEARATLTATEVEADGQVKSAQSQLAAAGIALDRARRVLREGAGSQRIVDEAQALSDLARKSLEAASARRDLLLKVVGEVDQGSVAPVAIDCPADGILWNVSAAPGQTVPSGAALFEIVDTSTAWVRVPVYVGNLAYLDPAAAAAVGDLSGRPGDPSVPAKAVSAPPSANALSGTADLFFELDNHDARFRPGQRVGVTLTLTGGAAGPVAPWAAVVHDIFGGTWVYERVGERTYSRRRVTVRFVAAGVPAAALAEAAAVGPAAAVRPLAVLDEGPKAGTAVVTAGAAELFGTETGYAK